jgi:hypothetical protein
MGVAAYNRGSQAIRRQLDDAAPDALTHLAHGLNAAPRAPDAGAPFPTEQGLTLAPGHGGWWLSCNVTGFGYWYRTPWQAMRRWLVDVVAIANNPIAFTCRAWEPARVQAHRNQ